MRVFKFGGASVKNAEGVKNVASILNLYKNDKIVVVVSAMGKSTNNLELLVDAFFFKKENPSKILEEIKKYHFNILENLFQDKNHKIYTEIHNSFVELDWAIEEEQIHSYDCVYDQIVCLGEVISSKITSAYLNEIGINNTWIDARDFIKTDNHYREAKIDWSQTENLIQEKLVNNSIQHSKLFVTQGFIGSSSENYSTTLGREGSDYTAAIIAYSANATDVTIWKDVPGVLNADPKWFNDTKLIDQLSYQDAIELAYYGATVIHPKTIKPLQNKKIPLFVKSFILPTEKGTNISDTRSPLPIPSFIFKVNQVLISIFPKDFSFIVEENLSQIFKLFSDHQVKINLMQNSAISFSICTDFDTRKIPDLIKTLQKSYKVLYNENLELVTIRYYDQNTIDRVCVDKKVLVEQKSRYTVQLVVKNHEQS